MSLFQRVKQSPARILIGVDVVHYDPVALAVSGELVEWDADEGLSEAGIQFSDVLLNDLPEGGLQQGRFYVWEGVVTESDFEGSEGYVYKGAFRDLTAEEKLTLLTTTQLWPRVTPPPEVATDLDEPDESSDERETTEFFPKEPSV